jgi:hypothetical protein
MWNMGRQPVLIGDVILNHEPSITLYAEAEIPPSQEGIALLKDKLANLPDSRFAPSDPTPAHRTLKIGEVIETWHCYRATVVRLIREGQLHPIKVDGELQFDRLEVISLARSVPERPV